MLHDAIFLIFVILIFSQIVVREKFQHSPHFTLPFKFTVTDNLYGAIVCMFQNPPDWQEILQYFRGSELQNYFTKILEDDLKVMCAI